MPDPITHAVSYGGAAAAIALFFEVPPNVVGWALIGSVIAVMLLQKFSFKVGAFITMAGTFAGAATSPLIFKAFNISLIGIPFLLSFSIIFFWGVAIEATKKRWRQELKSWGADNDATQNHIGHAWNIFNARGH